jgi:thiamine biosynthesis protein ThiC
MRDSSKPKNSDVCTMCGEFCAIKEFKNAVGGKT